MIRAASVADIRNGVPARTPYVRTDERTDGRTERTASVQPSSSPFQTDSPFVYALVVDVDGQVQTVSGGERP